MPRVLRIINRFNLGGPTFNAAYLTRYMEPDYETLLVGGLKDDSEEDSYFIVNSLDLDYKIIPEMRRSINPRNDIVAYKRIKELIKEFKPDIVHTHASKAGTLGRQAAYKCNVPVILHTFHGHVFHSYFNALKAKTFIKIEQKLANISTRIIAISEKQKQELAETFQITTPDKIEVIPLGFDLSRFKTEMPSKRVRFRTNYLLDENEIAIGIVGRLVPIKNHKLFLEGIKYVKENSSKKIRAFIVGDGESRVDIENFCKELRIDYTDYTKEKRKATVTFTSWIKDVDEVYAGIDLVAMTSLNEGTPVSLIEAQASNRPIITTNTGGIENIVSPSTAILTKNGSARDFSHKLLSIVEDSDLLEKLGRNGWDFVSEKFHYTRLVNDMKTLYDKLLVSK